MFYKSTKEILSDVLKHTINRKILLLSIDATLFEVAYGSLS
jgi:hypothetical protein